MQKSFLVFFLIFFSLQNIAAQDLPEFSLVSLSGDTISSKALSGRVVYINIWQTYCKPCIEEIPVLNKLQEDFPEIVFLALTPATRSKAKKFVGKYPFAFPVLTEANEFVSKLKKGGFPLHMLIQKDGRTSFLEGSIRLNPKENIAREEFNKQLFDANYTRLSAFLTASGK
jgi:thiol-disulfide isomerase/thioredoxin